jgi:nitroreductase
MTAQPQPVLSLLDAIAQRRSARAFKPDAIATATLHEILRLGTQAPSAFNLQPWRFIVLQSADAKAKLSPCAFGQRQITEAPVVLICCGDTTAADPDNIEAVIALGQQQGAMPDAFADYMRTGIPQGMRDRPSFTHIEAWINRQVMLAVGHIALVAQAYGVDSCPMEGFSTAAIQETFGLPETLIPCCLLPLGYAADPLKQYGGRFPLDRICYGDRYGEPFPS